MLTLSEIKNLLNENDELQEAVRYDGSSAFEIAGVSFQNVECFGGREGAGEEHWVVFSVTENETTRTFKIEGSYASYVGSELDWDAVTEVESVPVTVKQWHPVSK